MPISDLAIEEESTDWQLSPSALQGIPPGMSRSGSREMLICSCRSVGSPTTTAGTRSVFRLAFVDRRDDVLHAPYRDGTYVSWTCEEEDDNGASSVPRLRVQCNDITSAEKRPYQLGPREVLSDFRTSPDSWHMQHGRDTMRAFAGPIGTRLEQQRESAVAQKCCRGE